MYYRRSSEARAVAVNFLDSLNKALLIDRMDDYEVIERNYIVTITGCVYGWACGSSNPLSNSIIKLIEVKDRIKSDSIKKDYISSLVKFIEVWKETASNISPEIEKFIKQIPKLKNETS